MKKVTVVFVRDGENHSVSEHTSNYLHYNSYVFREVSDRLIIFVLKFIIHSCIFLIY